jgi:soluble lytic murein transglycosylase-like protein
MSMTTEDLIRLTASQSGVPPDLAVAVARQESGLNQSARGTSGEVGVFQLMPGTASDLNVNPYDLNQNVQGGISYLKQMYDRFGDWTTALLAYNAGPGAVSSGKIPSSSQSYASKIMAVFGSSSTDAPADIQTDTTEAVIFSPTMTLILIAAALGVVMLFSKKDS